MPVRLLEPHVFGPADSIGTWNPRAGSKQERRAQSGKIRCSVGDAIARLRKGLPMNQLRSKFMKNDIRLSIGVMGFGDFSSASSLAQNVDWVQPTRGVSIAVDAADNVYTVDYVYAFGAEMILPSVMRVVPSSGRGRSIRPIRREVGEGELGRHRQPRQRHRLRDLYVRVFQPGRGGQYRHEVRPGRQSPMAQRLRELFRRVVRKEVSGRRQRQHLCARDG